MCFDLFDTKKQEFLSADDLDEIMRAMGFRPSKEELQVGIIMFWGFKPTRNGAPLGQEARLGFWLSKEELQVGLMFFGFQAHPKRGSARARLNWVSGAGNKEQG